MTDAMMSLRALAEKSADADVLRAMIGFAAQRLMELEGAGRTGAAHGERSQERLARRNGTVTGTSRRGPARSSRPSRGRGRAATSRASWNHAA